MRAYRGHLVHIAGAPRLEQSREHLVSVPDRVLLGVRETAIAEVYARGRRMLSPGRAG